MRILGADPGMTGALVVIDYHRMDLDYVDMPVTETDNKKKIIDWAGLQHAIEKLEPHCAIIEKVHSSPAMGVVSAFSFGASFGALTQAIASAKVPYQFVDPVVWTRRMGVSAKNPDSSRIQASQLMPQFSYVWPLKKHHGRSDAALLSLYGRKYVWGGAETVFVGEGK